MSAETRIHFELACHQGYENAITAPALCRELGWSVRREREVRKIIEQNANQHWPGVLCAIPGVGYFFATDMEEIVTYRDYLVSLSKAAKQKLARFWAHARAEGFNLKEVA